MDAVCAVKVAALLKWHMITPSPTTQGCQAHVEHIGDFGQNRVVAEELFERLSVFVGEQI